MAIQFNCPSCTQPIEVDDEVAGQSAACPYCGKVVTVPAQSTYRPAVSARPLEEPGASGGEARAGYEPGEVVPHGEPSRPPAYPHLPPYDSAGLHVGPSPDAQSRLAKTLGNAALACAAVVVALWVTQFLLVAPTMGRLIASTSQPSQQEAMRIMQTSPNYTYAGAAGCAALVFSMAGAGLAVFSLRQRAAGNWRGWVSIVVCGGTLACGLISMLLTMASGFAA